MSAHETHSQSPVRATPGQLAVATVNPMAVDNRLGTFLRARRDQLQPEDAGLPVDGRRRAPGLRRDELAELAGVSVDYYVRLERGRDRHPSDQVLDALARVLQLDKDGRQHLHELARPPIVAPPPPVMTLPPGAAQIVDSWDGPVTVGDHTGLVIAANDLAQALSAAHVPGMNGYRTLFLDPSMRTLYGEDWHHVATDVVAALHTAVGSTPDDPRLIALVGELSIASESFRTLWAHYDVGPRPGTGITHMNHPTVGPLALRFEKLAFTGHPGLGLVLFWAEPGTQDSQALERLATPHNGTSPQNQS
jgi:transcriptional regulator with XRE-family HTH domain